MHVTKLSPRALQHRGVHVVKVPSERGGISWDSSVEKEPGRGSGEERLLPIGS